MKVSAIVALSGLLSLGSSISIEQKLEQQPLSSIKEETNAQNYGEGSSFIDSIYGHLVNTASSIKHKQEKLSNGEVKLFNSHLSVKLEDGRINSYSDFEDNRNHPHDYPPEFYSAASNHYLSTTKINLPSNDDYSDLQHYSYFGGIVSFAYFPTFNCFNPETLNKSIDIAILGAPFDTGTSYRPGARFGPNSIRQAARRLGQGLTPVRGLPNSNLRTINPYNTSFNIVDCGDVPMTPFDNRVALDQLYRAQRITHNHTTSWNNKSGKSKVVMMGGDHTVTLLGLRSAYENFGKVVVIHFDSHIDTWDPKVLGGGISNYMGLNHGTFLHYAYEQGYLYDGDKNFHVGLRAPYIAASDEPHDRQCGFNTITARDIDSLGIQGIAKTLKDKIGTKTPVYISVDIDVLDPAYAPATGTMEPGGFTSRELLSILDSLEGLNIIGADVVEVAPAYDVSSGITSLAASQVIDSFLGLMLVREEFDY